eukprot:CAMPEP_0181339394 /NCGR_PEP_ID=MMETSP1101-20121128/29233_1 /TAXON_ID=46948 /ORGANISM="Rhodomonas abbreviata, Strain Caron Lab Isolate" /LENGTH=72 /DNA_ID=CAMNT_0023450361 /DNA_START=2733 /DNA_END=2951 /DNA_ORIENTATION=+
MLGPCKPALPSVRYAQPNEDSLLAPGSEFAVLHHVFPLIDGGFAPEGAKPADAGLYLVVYGVWYGLVDAIVR